MDRQLISFCCPYPCSISGRRLAFSKLLTDVECITSARRPFHPLTTLWLKKNVLVSNLSLSFATFLSCPLRLYGAFLKLKNYLVSVFSFLSVRSPFLKIGTILAFSSRLVVFPSQMTAETAVIMALIGKLHFPCATRDECHLDQVICLLSMVSAYYMLWQHHNHISPVD